MAVFGLLDEAEIRDGLGRLADDLRAGRWHERHGHLLERDEIDSGRVTAPLVQADGAVAIDTTHRMRLEAIGEHIRVLVDDRVVINVRDSSLSGGVPGLMTYKTRADFDNVVVNANPAYVAFADSFGGSSWHWHTEPGEWTRVEANGSWVYRQGDLSGDARLLRTGAEAGLGTLGDQIVQADLRPTAFSGADRWVGLIARYRDSGNYHYVTLRSSGSLQIRKLVDGTIQTLASVPFTVQTDVTYRVRFEAIGTRLRAYVNGTLQAEATDASLTREMSSAGVAMYKAALAEDGGEGPTSAGGAAKPEPPPSSR